MAAPSDNPRGEPALAVHALGGTQRRQPDDRPGVILAHGFTQNHRCWGPFATHLEATTHVYGVDLPGHGDSGHDDADLPRSGALLAHVTTGHVVVGYSMGGRIALHTALDPDAALAGLVLIGATAGITDASERESRRGRDRALAADLEHDVEAFIDRWLALPLFAGLGTDVQFRDDRLANRTEGMAATLRHRGTGNQLPLHDELHGLATPLLVIAGERDTKFRVQAQSIADAVGGNVDVAVIADAGHACHLERPAETASRVADWLNRRQA